MIWIAVALLVVAALVVSTISGKKGPADDLGAVSANWIADHRSDRIWAP